MFTRTRHRLSLAVSVEDVAKKPALVDLMATELTTLRLRGAASKRDAYITFRADRTMLRT